MTAIHRVTDIPGPNSRALLERRAAAVTRSLGRSTDVVIDRAEGARVIDVDGNTLIDLAGGIGMIATGHCPPSVVAAIHAQADRLIHSCALVATYEPYVALCELLNEVAPGDFPKKTLLANSGAEAVENAIKIARAYTKRPAILCFEGAYHGRTLLTLSLTSKYGLFKHGFGPYAPEIYRVAAPDLYRRPAEMSEDAYVAMCCTNLERALVTQIDPASLAAIIIEPVQGEAGFIPMPDAFLRKIRELCTRHDVVMIADEVQTGFGRTGTLFAVEQSGVVPDLVTTAKALGAGLPISATTGRADIMDAAHVGGGGGTYGGSPIACAGAIEAVKLIRQPAFLAHARRIGAVMRGELERWQASSKLIGDVRGKGPMLLVELVLDREAKTPAPDHALAAIKRAVGNGVVLIRAGLYSNCIRFMPPLNISEDDVMEGLAVVEEAIRHVEEHGVLTRDVIDPATEEVVTTLPYGGADEANRAIDAAHAALPRWTARTAFDRGAILLRVATLIRERVDALAAVTVRETGKLVPEAKGEWLVSANLFEWFAEEGKRVYGYTLPARAANRRMLVVHEPIGVVGVITAWNFPAYNPARAAAAALAAGCPVVIRPSELTPLSAMALRDLLVEAGCDAIELVHGEPHPIGQAMLDHPALRKISFTGSVPVGKLLMDGASRTMTRLSLELGGNAPVIVMPDADPVAVAKGAVAAKFRNAGQVCVSPQRFLVHRDRAKAFEEVAVEETRKLTIGPLITARHRDRVEELIATATASGASVRAGGKRPAGRGYFLEPTVLGDVSPDVVSEEIFGPVFAATTYDQVDDAIAAANRTRYGLAAYVFTNDLRLAMRACEQLEFGMIGVNEWAPQATEAPFSGRKDSGVGHEGGREGLLDNLETKLISIAL